MLYHCVQAGLDLAIVNSEKLHRYPSIPEEERKLAEDLIWWRGDDPIAAFAAHFRERKSTVTAEDRKSMPLDDRLARYILEGSKDGLVEDLNEALTTRGPLEIINGPLMKGMDEVGRLFNANQMIVAEVLQSAEAMKAAVAHLEPHMQKSESATKGKIILATVKGDVHDIGKNLVEIILSNNGYRVVNLGIKVPPEELIKAFREHRPRRDRAVGPAGEVGADDGRDGAGLEDRGNRLPDPGRRRRALEPLHANENRARISGTGRVRQRRDERARPRQSDHGLRAARIAQARARRAVEKDARGRAESRRCAGGRDPAHFIGASRRRDSEAARPEDSCDPQLRSRRDLRLHQSQEPLLEASRLSELCRGVRGRRSRRRASFTIASRKSRNRFSRAPTFPRTPFTDFSPRNPTAIAPS